MLCFHGAVSVSIVFFVDLEFEMEIVELSFLAVLL